MQHPAITTIEAVCRDFDGIGIFSVGAIRALRAMSHHWKDHLAEGRSPRIISEDIDEMVRQLEVMRAEIMRRMMGADATPAVCGKCGTSLAGDYCADETCPYSEWPQHVPLSELQEMPADDLREKYAVLPRIRVPAEVHDDAFLNRIEFDAALWFAQATDRAIVHLHDIGWSVRDVQATGVSLELRGRGSGAVLRHRAGGSSLLSGGPGARRRDRGKAVFRTPSGGACLLQGLTRGHVARPGPRGGSPQGAGSSPIGRRNGKPSDAGVFPRTVTAPGAGEMRNLSRSSRGCCTNMLVSLPRDVERRGPRGALVGGGRPHRAISG